MLRRTREATLRAKVIELTTALNDSSVTVMHQTGLIKELTAELAESTALINKQAAELRRRSA